MFRCSYVKCIYIYNVYVFLMYSLLEYYEVFFSLSFYGLCLKSILSDISIATPALFSCLFAWNICFYSSTFLLCRSFVLRWVSCRWNVCESCVLIHFERIEEGALIRVGNQSNVKRESKIHIVNKKRNEEGRME